MTEWKRVQGSQETAPDTVDTTSSPDVVYLRKNIEKVTVKNEMDDTEREVFEYDEKILTRDEYAVYLTQVNAANIDFLSAMSGIEI